MTKFLKLFILSLCLIFLYSGISADNAILKQQKDRLYLNLEKILVDNEGNFLMNIPMQLVEQDEEGIYIKKRALNSYINQINIDFEVVPVMGPLFYAWECPKCGKYNSNRNSTCQYCLYYNRNIDQQRQ